jgi:hypothetical protein
MSKKNIRKIKRSGTEPCEVCNIVTPLQEHHLRGREVLGWNHANNKVWICPTCHDRCHLGLIVIEGWFNTSEGRQLIWHNNTDESVTGNNISPPSYSP